MGQRLLDDLRDLIDHAIALVQRVPPPRHGRVGQEARAVGMLFGKLHEPPDPRLNRLLGRRVVDGLADLLDQQPRELAVGCEEAIVLVGEILIEGRSRDAGPTDYPRDVRSGIAMAAGRHHHAGDQAVALGALAAGAGRGLQVGAHVNASRSFLSIKALASAGPRKGASTRKAPLAVRRDIWSLSPRRA